MTVKKFWNLKQTTKNSAEITIYGDIGNSWWSDSISAKQFSTDLKALGDDLDHITVRMNSAGGSVFEGLAIKSILKNHKADITVHVDGYAASIASIIAMAGDKIVMAKGAMMMIHNPMTSVYGGEAKDFRDAADFLDKIRDSLVSVYADRTGLSAEELIQMLDAETWLSAEDAVSFGFADEIEENSAVSAYMSGAVASVNGVRMDFSRFLNVPQLPAPTNQSQNPAASATRNPNQSTIGGVTILNLEDLKNQYPDIYAAAVNEGVSTERVRMQGLDELATPGNTEIIAKAKSEGTSVAETAVAIIKADNMKRTAAGKKLQQDANNSGMDDVTAAAAEDGKATEDEKVNAKAQSIADTFNRMRGV